MRCIIRGIVTIAAFLALAGVAQEAYPDGTPPPGPMDVILEPQELPDPSGWVEIDLSVEPRYTTCEQLELHFIPSDGMVYEGQTSQVVPMPEDGIYRSTFRVFVAPDTSNMINVEAVCGEITSDHALTFLTYGDSLQYFKGFIADYERKRPVRRQPRGNIRPGELPKYDSTHGIPAPPGPDTDRQVYTRQLLDCIAGFSDDAIYDVYLELDRPDKLELALGLTDELEPLEDPALYLARTNRATLEKLSAAGAWLYFKEIHLQVAEWRLLPLVKKPMIPLLDSAQMAPLYEMEKAPLLDSAQETVIIEGFRFYRERGQNKFRYAGRETPKITIEQLIELEKTPLTGPWGETHVVSRSEPTRHQLQLTVIEDEVEWVRGDILSLNVELANPADTTIKVHSHLPVFRLWWMQDSEYLVDGMFFVGSGKRINSAPLMIDPQSTDTLEVAFERVIDPPGLPVMYVQLQYHVIEDEPVRQVISVTSSDSVKVNIVE